MRCFSGKYDATQGRSFVQFDGRPFGLPALRPDEHRHSPDGFSWGYSGSGPAELARAILIAVLPDEPAVRHPGCYQRFKAEIIAAMAQEWMMTEKSVLAWFGMWQVTDRGREILENLAHLAALKEEERGGEE